MAACHNPRRLLQPKHIEVPEFDPAANVYLDGHIVVTAVIDANGAVIETRATGQPILAKIAMQNLRRWTFEKPRHSPWEQTIVYDYRLEGPASCHVSPSLVTFDLPDRVTIVTNRVHECDPSVTIPKRRD